MDARTLKDVSITELEELKVKTKKLGQHLELALRKAKPCQFNRGTVEEAIRGVAHYTFKKMTELCDHLLFPLLHDQVERVLDKERPSPTPTP